MATTYNYTEFTNPINIDEMCCRVSLAKEIETALPNKTFKIIVVGTNVSVIFTNALTIEEETILTNTYNTYNSYSESTFTSIARNWQTNYKDFKLARKELSNELTTRGGFYNLAPLEKKIASRWFIVAISDRNTVHSFSEQITNGIFFHTNSVASRQSRYTAAVVEVYTRLASTDADEVIDDLWEIFTKVNGKQYSRSLAENYIQCGREGTVEGNPDGLFDYVLARANTAFSSSGLKAKLITPNYGTLDELCDRIIDILKNGNY